MFFFFPDNESGGLTTSLSGEINNMEVDLDRVRQNLSKETEKQGLRNNDLADLTGWSTSKTSKITAGKQKITSDDAKCWSRALGFTPDPFIDNNVDLRAYKVSAYVRSLTDAFEAFFDSMDDKISNAIVSYEIPLAIFTLLGVNASDYAVRASASFYGINPDSKLGITDTATYIKMWQRTTKSIDEMVPEFGVWFSPENDKFLFAVYLHRDVRDGAIKQLRQQYKDTLQIEDSETENFDTFARQNKSWVPRYVMDGEIFSFGSDTNNFPYSGQLDNSIIELYKRYCSLVWEVKGIDLLPPKLKAMEGLSSFDQLDILQGYADFLPEIKEVVKVNNDFLCENGKDHTSFTDQNGRRYMNVVPLIPFMQGSQFGKVILSEANALCLCPNCSAQLQYGINEDREDMIIKLYRKHKEDLFKHGIELSLTQVLAMNNLT